MNSPKFAVTSERRFGLQGCRSLRTLSLPARIEGKFVEFVPRDCYEQWRLATLQLPENFSKERHLSRLRIAIFPPEYLIDPTAWKRSSPKFAKKVSNTTHWGDAPLHLRGARYNCNMTR